MLRRRPIARAAVGTAVVAGTATAVSGRVARRQEARYAAAQPAQPAAVPQEAAPAAEAAPRDVAAQLKDLATLKEQGVLTDAEFAAEKQRILAGG